MRATVARFARDGWIRDFAGSEPLCPEAEVRSFSPESKQGQDSPPEPEDASASRARSMAPSGIRGPRHAAQRHGLAGVFGEVRTGDPRKAAGNGPGPTDASSPVQHQLRESVGAGKPGRECHAREARGAGCREDRGAGGLWGGAGACALRPCHIGMSRSAERRRRRLRRSAGAGGRGELPAAPLCRAQQEGGREQYERKRRPARASAKKERKKTSERACELAGRASKRARENSRQVKKRGGRLGLPARRPEGWCGALLKRPSNFASGKRREPAGGGRAG